MGVVGIVIGPGLDVGIGGGDRQLAVGSLCVWMRQWRLRMGEEGRGAAAVGRLCWLRKEVWFVSWVSGRLY